MFVPMPECDKVWSLSIWGQYNLCNQPSANQTPAAINIILIFMTAYRQHFILWLVDDVLVYIMNITISPFDFSKPVGVTWT